MTAHPIDSNGDIINGSRPVMWHGSGFVVGMRTVYSAAHVLEEPSISSTGIPLKITSAVFSPQHPSVHVRRWSARQIIIHDSYFINDDVFSSGFSTNLAFDMAAMVTDWDEEPVGQVTGRLGWKTNVQLPVASTGIGYPANPPTEFGFDGNVMWESAGQTRSGVNQGFANFRFKDNDMTRGCSGGPWAMEDGSGQDRHKVIGLNSHVTDVSDFNPMVSPVFDDDFLEVLRGVKELELDINAGVPGNSPEYKRLL